MYWYLVIVIAICLLLALSLVSIAGFFIHTDPLDEIGCILTVFCATFPLWPIVYAVSLLITFLSVFFVGKVFVGRLLLS